MSPLVPPTTLPDHGDIPADELTQLELQIARRADELVRNRSREGTQDPWMQAEREVLRRVLAGIMPSPV